jgi:hypothetical protein
MCPCTRERNARGFSTVQKFRYYARATTQLTFINRSSCVLTPGCLYNHGNETDRFGPSAQRSLHAARRPASEARVESGTRSVRPSVPSSFRKGSASDRSRLQNIFFQVSKFIWSLSPLSFCQNVLPFCSQWIHLIVTTRDLSVVSKERMT